MEEPPDPVAASGPAPQAPGRMPARPWAPPPEAPGLASPRRARARWGPLLGTHVASSEGEGAALCTTRAGPFTKDAPSQRGLGEVGQVSPGPAKPAGDKELSEASSGGPTVGPEPFRFPVVMHFLPRRVISPHPPPRPARLPALRWTDTRACALCLSVPNPPDPGLSSGPVPQLRRGWWVTSGGHLI